MKKDDAALIADHPVSPNPVRGFAHAGVTVTDMERALVFYRGLLGLEVMADYLIDTPYIFKITGVTGTAIRIAYLRVPQSDVHVELLEYTGCERHTQRTRPCDPGNGHLSLYVQNLDATYRRLAAAGVLARSDGPVTITQGPRTGNKALYVADPDGYYIELVEETGRAVPAPQV